MFDSVLVELSVPGKDVKAAGGVTAAAVLIPILGLVQHYIHYHRIVWLDIRGCCKREEEVRTVVQRMLQKGGKHIDFQTLVNK